MRIKRIHFQNYRCFPELRAEFGTYACLVGQNNSGKSTVLAGIDAFFRTTARGTSIVADDFFDADQPLVIGITFCDLSSAAQQEFSHYYRGGELTFSVRCLMDGRQITSSFKGLRLVMADFAPFFEANGAAQKRDFYNAIRDRFDLPAYTNKDAAETNLRQYEDSHPELCEIRESSDDAFGVAGPISLLRKYVEWIYVPAVKDAALEQLEARNTAFGKLVQRAIRSKLNLSREIDAIKADVQQRVERLQSENKEALQELNRLIDADFKSVTSLDVNVHIDWVEAELHDVVIKEPMVRSLLDDGGYRGDVSSFGHGLQRNYLIALLHLNAKLSGDTQPALILGCEEPELYQHPPQVRYLYRVFKRLSESNQVLLTTHSPHFVSAKDFASIFIVRKKGRTSRLCTHSVAAQGEMVSKAKLEARIGLDASEALLHSLLQPNIAEMFFCEKIIFVEGIEDHAIVESYLEKRGIKERFLKAGGHILPVGGKTNLIATIALARGFQLPFIAMFDGDTGCRQSEVGTTKELNSLLLRLAEHERNGGEYFWPENTYMSEKLIVWPKDIQSSIESDYPDWVDDCKAIATKFNYPYDRLRKNPSLINAALDEIYAKAGSIDCLDRMSTNFLSLFEQPPTEVSVGDK